MPFRISAGVMAITPLLHSVVVDRAIGTVILLVSYLLCSFGSSVAGAGESAANQ